MANKTVAAVVKLIDQFSSPSKTVEKQSRDLEKRFKNLGNTVKNVGNIFGGVGSTLSKGITAPIMGIGTATTKMALDFEESMAKVSTIADSTEVPMKKMQSAIIELSNQTGIAAGEIADNVYDAISAGQKTGDAVNFVANSTKLAKAGFADSGAALDILTTTLNAYGMEAEKVAQVSDVLIQTQNLGKTTVGDLASSMGKIIPTAKSYNVAFEQIAAGYAVMTSNGIATAETTTYMNSMLNELGKSGTKVADILKEQTGKSFGELMNEGNSISDVLEKLSDYAETSGKQFGDLWSSAEAGKAALTLLGSGAEGFNSTLEKMNNAAGATDEAFNKLQTNGFSIEKTLNMLKNTGIELGTTILEMLSPAIETVSEKVSEASKWFSGLDDSTKKNIVRFAGMAAAAGPLFIGIEKVTTGIGGAIDTIGSLAGAVNDAGGVISALTNPVGIVVAAVAAGALLIYKNWDSIAPVFERISGKVSEFWNTAEPLLSGFIDLAEKVGSVVLGVLDAAFKVSFGAIAGYIESGIDTATKVVDGFKTMLGGVVDFISGAFTGNWEKAWNGAVKIFGGAWSGLSALVKAPINAVIGIVNGAIDGINSIKFTVPSWVPGIGGKGWEGLNIGHIPQLARGTDYWLGGIAQINEKGGEIVDLPRGSRVYPHDESMQMLREQARSITISIAKLADQIIVREEADIDRIADAIVTKAQETAANMA